VRFLVVLIRVQAVEMKNTAHGVPQVSNFC
jgi:hypothetical protein